MPGNPRGVARGWRSIFLSGVLFHACGVLLGVSLVRGPYLGRPADDQVAVVWLTDVSADSRVDYAREGEAWETISSPAAVTRHVAVIGNLASGELYRYRVWSGGALLGLESTFRAPRSSRETRFRFGVIGDTAGVEVPMRIAGRLAESDVDFVLHTGDVVYPSGAQKNYDDEFFIPFSRLVREAPILPTIGNHDAMTDRGAPLLANFVMPVNEATGESRFFALRHANVLFVCLDVESSAFGAGSAQYEWLLRTLRGSEEPWKIVYFHAPPYSSASPNRVARLILSPLFERYGADVVFSGHEHLYERTHPIRDFVSTGPGVVYVTEGGGGASLTPEFHQQDNSAYVSSRVGYVEVEIDGSRLILSAREPDGSVFDSVILEKPEDVPPRLRLVVTPARAPSRSLLVPR